MRFNCSDLIVKMFVNVVETFSDMSATFHRDFQAGIGKCGEFDDKISSFYVIYVKTSLLLFRQTCTLMFFADG